MINAIELRKFLNRYLAGGCCLAEARLVSRKSLFLSNSGAGLRKRITLELNSQINSFNEASLHISRCKHFNPETFIFIHNLLVGEGNIKSNFRESNVLIKDGSGDVIYKAPDSSNVFRLLESLCDYMNDKSIECTHKAINSYVTFVRIHPFLDGNGRVARAIYEGISSRKSDYKINFCLYKLGGDFDKYFKMLDCGLNENKMAHQSDFFKLSQLWVDKYYHEYEKLKESLIVELEFYFSSGWMSKFNKIIENVFRFPVFTAKKLFNISGVTEAEFRYFLFYSLEVGFLSTSKVGEKKITIFECRKVLDFYEKLDNLMLIGKS